MNLRNSMRKREIMRNLENLRFAQHKQIVYRQQPLGDAVEPTLVASGKQFNRC
jgi:hypothetical protein